MKSKIVKIPVSLERPGREPLIRIKRKSLVGRVVSLDRRLHRPVKREGAFVGNRPCGVQFSGVPRKQDEVPKCNLSPSEERQAAATGFHLKLLHQKKEHPSGLAKPLLL